MSSKTWCVAGRGSEVRCFCVGIVTTDLNSIAPFTKFRDFIHGRCKRSLHVGNHEGISNVKNRVGVDYGTPMNLYSHFTDGLHM